MDIAGTLKKLRAQRNLTQRQVYESVGMGATVYQRYELGLRTPRLEQLIALADYFDVSVDYLIGRTDDPTRPPAPKE